MTVIRSLNMVSDECSYPASGIYERLSATNYKKGQEPSRMHTIFRVLTVCFVLVFAGASLAQIAPSSPGVDDARMRNASREPQNWLVNGGTFAGEHYSALDQINLRTISRLRPAWSFAMDSNRDQEAEPLVVDGVMYVSAAWSHVYALDAASGKLIWAYDPRVAGEVGVKACCDVVNRGVAVYKGRVYLGALDGRLIALDARTGTVVWSVMTVDPKGHYTITGAPRAVRDKIIIGNSGADFGIRGYVSAYDAATGKMVWRFYTAPGDPAKGPDRAASDNIMETLVRPTWAGDYYKYGGGANAWNAIQYDPELNQLYVGTGNGSPWNPQFRTAGKGDNLFICSVIALDPDTGRYIWHYQENPQEAWDYNSVQPMILATLRIDGAMRKVLLHAPKNGFFYVIDRTSGKLISAAPIVKDISWAKGIDLATGRPIEADNVRYTKGPFAMRPGTVGAHSWHPIAFDPNTGLVYLAVRDSQTIFSPQQTFVAKEQGPYNTATPHVASLGENYLLAWNPATQTEAWRVALGPSSGGGVLATAGGMVFQGHGQVSGDLMAFRSDSGQQVWSQHVPNGIVAGAITYSVNGEQYVAVATGAGSGFTGGMDARMRQPGRVVAFKLDGKAQLPNDPAPAPGANPATETWSPDALKLGQAVYGENCSRCHGGGAASSNVIPDLRRSAAITNRSLWNAIVLNGALTARGMVGWSQYIDAGQADAIRGYVSEQAKLLQQKTSPVAAEKAPDGGAQ